MEWSQVLLEEEPRVPVGQSMGSPAGARAFDEVLKHVLAFK